MPCCSKIMEAAFITIEKLIIIGTKNRVLINVGVSRGVSQRVQLKLNARRGTNHMRHGEAE